MTRISGAMRIIGGGYLRDPGAGGQKVFLQVHSRNVLLSFSEMAGGIHYQLFMEKYGRTVSTAGLEKRLDLKPGV
ncbi:MAG: hypothetical protein LUQ69_06600 [Methanoregulaceae archaeon]|nr:hypothetical protein [Methanoregulaceae archaeon]